MLALLSLKCLISVQVKQLLDGHLPDQSDLGKMESQSIEKLISDEATTGEAFRQACSTLPFLARCGGLTCF